MFFTFYFAVVFFYPDSMGHPDNYIPANPMVTPAHIVPEWYFLPMYAILRSIPNKLLGVIAMFASLLSWLLIPFIAQAKVRSTLFRPMHKFLFWLFLANCMLLGWIGQCPAETPYIEIGQVGTFFYFAYIFVLLPGLGWFENQLFDSVIEQNK